PAYKNGIGMLCGYTCRVGRVRKDTSQPRTLNLWIVADNLRKGAATNALQIAESWLALHG
ncbi:MAG: Asd/ArgC dimerization domain-containing protein, partial [Bacteroidota bacterium]